MASEEVKDDLRILEINKEFLYDLLGRNISSFKITSGSNPGDNYLSIMHAVEVNFEDEDIPTHIVIKCVPNHPTRREFIEETNVFRKEFFIYDSWIPTLKKMQDKIGTCSQLELPFPPYLGGQVSNPYTANDTPSNAENEDEVDVSHNYIAMIDMRTPHGYKMADRCKGADYDHCKLVIQEMAKIHAFSWAYKQRNAIKRLSDIYPNFKDEMFIGKGSEQFEPLMDDILNSSMKIIEKGLGSNSPAYIAASRIRGIDFTSEMASFLGVNGPDEERVENLLRIKPSYDTNYTTEPWLLGCHGDCWLNNMLFKYDEATGKPEKVILVDLQLYREACPTTDLIYFFLSSTTSQTRRNHEESLINLYHDKFLEYCAVLKCKPLPGFNLKSLKRRYHRAKVIGFSWSMPLLVFVLKEPEKSVNLDSLDDGQDMTEMFSNVTAGSEENNVLSERLCQMAQELYEAGVL